MNQGTRRLLWRGRESVELIRALLGEPGGRVELEIPADYHHTLYSRLCRPQGRTLHFEQLDLRGGPELFESLAAIRGLEELGDLVEPARAASARLRLLSPSPKLLIEPGG